MKYVTQTFAFIMQFGKPCPTRDWVSVLTAASLLGIGFIAFAVYLFLGLQSGFIFKPAETGVPGGPGVTREALNEVITLYETRLTNFQTGNIQSANISDPR